MKEPYTIIKRPLITEKSMTLGSEGKYAFEVDIKANKIEVAQAVEAIFPNVNVVKVNTLLIKGKKKRMGRHIGKTPNWKKAYVTLQPGQQIKIFEGA